MLPSAGYFATFPCPFFENDLCQRPYCHFQHSEDSRIQAANCSASSGKRFEDIVQEAVRKVLISQSTSKVSDLLETLDANTVSKIIREKPEVASDGVERHTGQNVPPAPVFDGRGRRLYLKPKTAPAYEPTPIESLKLENVDATFSDPEEVDVAGDNPAQRPATHHLPGGLAQLSKLKPKTTFSDAKASSKRFLKREHLLGDISDLSESDENEEEGDNVKNGSTHVVGSILLEGLRSGVLSNVNEFENELLKTRFKVKKKDSPPSEVPCANDALEGVEKGAATEVQISCDKVSSSSEASQKAADGRADDTSVDPRQATAEKRLDDECEQARKRLEVKERELKRIDEKRKVLQNFYRNKRLILDSNYPAKAEKQQRDDLKERQGGANKCDTVVILNHSGASTKHVISLEEKRPSHVDVKKRSTLDDERKHFSDKSRKGRHRRRHKTRDRRHRDAARDSNSKSSSANNEGQGGNAGPAERRRKTGSVSSSYDQASSEKACSRQEKTGSDYLSGGSANPLSNYMDLVSPEVLLSTSADIVLGKNSDGRKARLPSVAEWASESSNDIASELDVSDDKLPDDVKSFLDIMNDIDAQILRGATSDKNRSASEPNTRRNRSQGHRPDHRYRKDGFLEDLGKEPKQVAGPQSYKTSWDTHLKQSGSNGPVREKPTDALPRTKKDADTSRHKSSVKVELRSRQNSEVRIEGPDKRADSPLMPDLTAELDMLPEELDRHGDVASDGQHLSLDEDEDVFDDDDDELRRIFEEFVPEDGDKDAHLKKARRLEVHNQRKDFSDTVGTDGGQAKKRTAHVEAKNRADPGAPKRVAALKRPTPGQVLMQRYQQAKVRQEDDELDCRLSELTEGKRRRIAHKSTGEGHVNSTVKRQLEARREATETEPSKRTVAHTLKGLPRLEHTPKSDNVTNRPFIDSSGGSQVPTNIRQRYLNSIVDECVKIYPFDKQRAHQRAVDEEKACLNRSKNRNIYLNVIVNCIKKIRKEAEESVSNRQASTSGAVGSSGSRVADAKRPMLTTHLQVLAGKAGTVGTWSIEKPKRKLGDTDGEEEISDDLLYTILRRYVLTEEQLVDNRYPRPDPREKGKVVVKEDPRKPKMKAPLEADRRICDRCLKTYRVDKFGRQVVPEECIYHWGKLFKKRGSRATGYIQTYSCCQGEVNSEGCQVHNCHVMDTQDYNDMKGFVATMKKEGGRQRNNPGVFALDCEMCCTLRGNELTRVTVVDCHGKTVYESVVKPDSEIIDYNTRFSGITSEDLDGVRTTLRDVQAVLLSMFCSETILIGHSLESDLKALKLLHDTVIDTSVVFPHKMGPPYKRALKSLAVEYLNKIIQNDVGGHDSAEDALTCLELMKVKSKEDVKKLRLMAAAEARKRN